MIQRRNENKIDCKAKKKHYLRTRVVTKRSREYIEIKVFYQGLYF